LLAATVGAASGCAQQKIVEFLSFAANRNSVPRHGGMSPQIEVLCDCRLIVIFDWVTIGHTGPDLTFGRLLPNYQVGLILAENGLSMQQVVDVAGVPFLCVAEHWHRRLFGIEHPNDAVATHAIGG